MKNLLFKHLQMLSVAIAVFLFTITAQAKANTADSPYLTKTFNLSSGELYVSTSGGSIKVEGGSGNTVKVEMYVRSSKHSDEKIKEMLEDEYEIKIGQTGSRVEAIAKRLGSGWNWNSISISFVVYTPKNFTCELNTSGGSLNLSGVSGSRQSMRTSGGSIHAERISGGLDVNTSGGSIHIDELSGNLKANTSGGSINLTAIRGDIDAHTSGGGINITDVQGYVSATTSGGSITANISKLEKQLVLKTSGGSVNATIPPGLGLNL
ncbi:MAG: DUF4097 family beta strand repeat-containing protein [Cyclobacteriaceae bacterium]|nr:DUF4097 family beta strand repeat-containing protein [Cyclobacteriaceae bacterium]